MPKLKVVLIEGTMETEVNTKHSAMKALNPLKSTGLYAALASDEVSPAGNKSGVSALATVAVGSVVAAPAWISVVTGSRGRDRGILTKRVGLC
jgi:hypothetical protein